MPGRSMGTPSYMAPEQARGEIKRVDERADVFALGSILCEVLTGKPAFVGRSSGEIQRKAALGDLGEAFGRLDAAGPTPSWWAWRRSGWRRSRKTGRVTRVWWPSGCGRTWPRSRSGCGRPSWPRRWRMRGRRRRSRRRRRPSASGCRASGAVADGGPGGGDAVPGRPGRRQLLVDAQRAGRFAATARAVDEALNQAVRHQGEAHAAGDDLSKWAVALAQMDRAGDLVKPSEADPLLRDRVATVRAEIERGRAEVEEHARRVLADRTLLETLETDPWRFCRSK